MKTITLTFAGDDFVFQYNDTFTIVKLYNDHFKGFFEFVFVPVSCGQTIYSSDVLNIIKTKTSN